MINSSSAELDRANAQFETLVGLLQHYSPSGEEAKTVEWLVKRMHALGFDRTFIDEAGNAVGIMGSGPKQLVLLGHVDTVPGRVPVRRHGNLLYGRGAVDAKGPLAAFVDAVAQVGEVAGWQWVVVGCVDEERESTGARYAVSQYRPAFAIIGEPSRWERITLGYKGSAYAAITLSRAVAHSAARKENACEAAIAVWKNIQDWCKAYNTGYSRTFDKINASIRGMASGSDGLEDWARLDLGVRLPTAIDPDDWYRLLSGLAEGAEVKIKGFAVPAYQAEKNTALVRAFLAAIRSVGGQPNFVLKTGTADLNIVAPAWRCPAVAYGPGDSNLDHTPHEHISLNEYALSVRVLVELLGVLVSTQ